MADTWQNHQSSSDFILEKAILNSTRQSFAISLRTIDYFEIYENLAKPYLTGTIAVEDPQRVFERIDFSGGETLELTIRRGPDAPAYKKEFILDRLISSHKISEDSEVYVFHMVEKTAFISQLMNVNKAYSGQISDIINDIYKDTFNKEIIFPGQKPIKQNMKVIVPNMHPYQAMSWLCNQAVTENGFPFYLFSVFADDDYIYMASLEDILSQPVLNSSKPYVYTQSASNTEGPQRLMTIKNYSIRNNEDMLEMIENGNIGANYNFIDTMTARYKKSNYNIIKDLAPDVVNKNKRQGYFNIPDDFVYNDVNMSEYQSKNITSIRNSGAYTIIDGSFASLHQEDDNNFYKKHIIAKSLRHLMSKSIIEVTLNGPEFMSTGTRALSRTVGNNIRLIFPANAPSQGKNMKIDAKKSGDYTIFSAKHSFAGENYNIRLMCCKVANYTSDTLPTDVVM